MAYSNFADLKAAITDDLARSDVTARILRATAEFESKFNRTARVAEMETAVTLGPLNGQITLPVDFNELRDVVASYGYCEGYYISGLNLILPSTGSDDVTILYYAKLPPLVNDSDTNWLLAGYPDIYLNGVITAMGPNWVPNLADYKALYDLAFEDLRSADLGKRWNGMAATISGPTP